jgi:hypothetical protein
MYFSFLPHADEIWVTHKRAHPLLYYIFIKMFFNELRVALLPHLKIKAPPRKPRVFFSLFRAWYLSRASFALRPRTHTARIATSNSK